MLPDERFRRILEIIRKKQSVTVQELVKQIGISESTVRGDLAALDKKGLLHKVHGGATSIDAGFGVEETVAKKSLKNVDEKRRIAQYCAEIIRPDDFIYLDAGTTTEMMIDFLTEKKASYVTNGIMHAKKLMDYGFRVYLIGGELRAVTEAVVGEEALESLRKYNFTKGFFGINGISKKSGFTTPDVNEALVKKTALSQCLDAYILADASKFGRISAVCVAGLDQAVIVTGKLKEPSFLKYTAIKEVSE